MDKDIMQDFDQRFGGWILQDSEENYRSLEEIRSWFASTLLSEKAKIADRILNHRFKSFTATNALMVGNVKLSTVSESKVVLVTEVYDVVRDVLSVPSKE